MNAIFKPVPHKLTVEAFYDLARTGHLDEDDRVELIDGVIIELAPFGSDHATARGLYLHFKLQENEIDDNRRGEKLEGASISESLDGGKLGPQRKLYCREIIARKRISFAEQDALLDAMGEFGGLPVSIESLLG